MGHVSIEAVDGDVLAVRYMGAIDDDEFARHLDEFQSVLERDPTRLWTIIADGTERENRTTPVSQRKMQAEWIRKNSPLLRDRVKVSIFVIDGAVMRGGLTAILWLQPLPIPHHVVGTFERAMHYAHRHVSHQPLSKTA